MKFTLAKILLILTISIFIIDAVFALPHPKRIKKKLKHSKSSCKGKNSSHHHNCKVKKVDIVTSIAPYIPTDIPGIPNKSTFIPNGTNVPGIPNKPNGTNVPGIPAKPKIPKKPNYGHGSSSSGDTSTHSGSGTFYNPGLGACGQTDSDSDTIVAMGAPYFDQYTPNGNPNHNTLCGKQIKIHYNGKSAIGTIEDRCPECAGGDVDMSPAVFNQLADPSQGRIPITWELM
ncbi:296_t:CDS:2 [Ambispora leptoticha]|uniref:296_t:CDS:1 n=1 Tax=Ambispora leptoticha TaxID=144679 RepID=A0A9N9DVV1_9GLOM|nr:296_t:CDS:2 [Ambispora leptoticha]